MTIDFDSVKRIRAERSTWLARSVWSNALDCFRQLASHRLNPCQSSLNTASVTLLNDSQLPVAVHDANSRLIEELHPWRKGPFQLFDRKIDAEWCSDQKWSRIESAVGDLREHRILDVGCGNGYYMFRMAAQQPRCVLGIDPSVQFLLQFELFQHYLQLENLQYELLGAEHLPLFRKTFDTVFCMGILYHQRSPIEVLRNIRQSLRIGGQCVIESQTIPGDEPVALFPKDRYAKARNVYFVPTASCLANWVQRSGFTDVEIVSHERVTPEEQRRTPFMRFESLADFLDPQNPAKTIEGYPAPWRTAVIGRRSNT